MVATANGFVNYTLPPPLVQKSGMLKHRTELVPAILIHHSFHVLLHCYIHPQCKLKQHFFPPPWHITACGIQYQTLGNFPLVSGLAFFFLLFCSALVSVRQTIVRHHNISSKEFDSLFDCSIVSPHYSHLCPICHPLPSCYMNLAFRRHAYRNRTMTVLLAAEGPT